MDFGARRRSGVIKRSLRMALKAAHRSLNLVPRRSKTSMCKSVALLSSSIRVGTSGTKGSNCAVSPAVSRIRFLSYGISEIVTMRAVKVFREVIRRGTSGEFGALVIKLGKRTTHTAEEFLREMGRRVKLPICVYGSKSP